MNARILEFKVLGDEKGSLVALESNKNVPFDIKRVFYIFGTKEGVRRGCHAHKKLNQVLVCVSGSSKILLDDGVERNEILLGDPRIGLYVGNMIWCEIYDLSDDCVIVVLASDYYDEADYIRRYKDFLHIKFNLTPEDLNRTQMIKEQTFTKNK